MNAVWFLVLRQMKNKVRRVFSKPGSAVLTCFVCIFYILGPVMMILNPRKITLENSLSANLIVSIIPLFVGILFLNALFSQQSGIFTAADVNFMFTSPLTPRQGLVYAMIQTAPASFLTTILMTLWLPYVLGGNMGVAALLASLFDMILMFCGMFLCYYFIYILSVANTGAMKAAKAVLYAVIGALAVVFCAVMSQNGWKIGDSARFFFSSPLYSAVPLFGWVRWGMTGAMTGNYLGAFLPATLLLIAFALAPVFGMLSLKIDYYEKALNDSVRVQQALEMRRSGSDARSLMKVRNKNVKSGFMKGAAAICSKQWLEMRKSSPFFTFRDFIVSIIYVILAAVMNLGFYFALAMIVFMMMANTSSEAWNHEFKKPYAYLIPEKPLKKLIYSILPGLLKTMFSGGIAVLLAAILLHASFFTGAAGLLIFIACDLLFVCSEVFSYRILGTDASQQALVFLRMLLALASAVPSVFVFVIVEIATGGEAILAASVGVLAVNIALSALLLLLSRKLFENCEIMS